MRFARDEPPFERAPPAADVPALPYPAAFRPRLLVCTLHDGDVVPACLLDNPRVAEAHAHGALWRPFTVARDWGADLVASHVAAYLGLADTLRVRTARLVMDFNRFPGESAPDAEPLHRRALGAPLAGLLTHADKRYVLERHYDAVSRAIDDAITGRLIALSVHTYDEHNTTRTRRPAVSLVTRSDSYQRLSRLPYGLFDPLFPPVLTESCAKPVVRDRVALTLEKAGYAVEHNYPYSLPDGSIELRSQPWLFFQHLRATFTAERPETRDEPAWERVWEMLLNTNLRDRAGDALAAYLHRFQRPDDGDGADLEASRLAYEQLRTWLTARPEVVDAYRRSPDRTSTIAIEVRKDLVWRFEDGEPVGPREDTARDIARHIALGVATYLTEDR